MRRHPTLLLLLIPLFAGCQSLGWKDEAPPRATERLQGQLTVIDGQLAFRSCQGERRLRLVDSIDSGLLDDALALGSDTGTPLFTDVRGVLQRQNNEDRMELTRLYRVQAEGHGCDAQGFRQLLLAAHGNEPGKTLRVTREGIAPATNSICGYVVVEAETIEAAARLFENHPHFMVFPGDAVDIMPFMT